PRTPTRLPYTTLFRSLRHAGGERVAVDGERRAGGNPRLLCGVQQDGTERAHVPLQQTMRVRRIFALERVRADQLGEAVGLVCRCTPDLPHLDQRDVVAPLGELPRGLAAGQSRTDDECPRHVSAPDASTRPSSSRRTCGPSISPPSSRRRRRAQRSSLPPTSLRPSSPSSSSPSSSSPSSSSPSSSSPSSSSPSSSSLQPSSSRSTSLRPPSSPPSSLPPPCGE